MSKQNEGRSTVRVELRLIPWPAFALRAYAKHYGIPISEAAMRAINCILTDTPEHVINQWIDDYHKAKNHVVL